MIYGTFQVHILYTLRKNGEMPFDEFLLACDQYPIGVNSRAIHFFSALARLIKEGFVRLSDSRLSSGIKNMNKPVFSTVPGKPLYDLLERKKPEDLHKVRIRLTDKLYETQEILGFSITDSYESMIAERDHRHNRYFRKVYTEDVRCDVFVAMSFDDDMKPVYDVSIKNVCDKLGLVCKRVDSNSFSEAIIDMIWTLINEAEIVICDCTRMKPNVYYELGIAHALNKKTICITQNLDDIRFDIQHLQTTLYENSIIGAKELEKELEKKIVALRGI